MALKLLNPGLRPLGQFYLEDNDMANMVGGEYVQLRSTTGDDGYAADVGMVGPLVGPLTAVGGAAGMRFELTGGTAGAPPPNPGSVSESLGGLCDEGIAEYGTLFGNLIGHTTGQATNVSGAVVIGPSSARGSGKVTVWSQAGLYGVNGTAATGSAAPLVVGTAPNTAIHSELNTGRLGLVALGGDQLASHVGTVADSSLVSTTNTAAGLAAAAEYFAVYFLGNYVT